MLWNLVDRIEELHYSTEPQQLAPFLSSLGPAPNLKVLGLRPKLTVAIGQPSPLTIHLPIIFSGCLPSLRDLTLTNTVTWPPGLFRGLIALECGSLGFNSISLVHVLDVLRDSPSIEHIQLVGSCDIPSEFNPPAVTLRSLGKCTLDGRGTTSLVQFMTIPASALVFLRGPYTDGGVILPEFQDLSKASGHNQVIDKVSAVSFSINDYRFRFRAKNDYGGILDIEVYGLDDLAQDPETLAEFFQSFFRHGRTYPGFKTVKESTLEADRGRIWECEEETPFVSSTMLFIFNLPGVEELKLRGFPPLELSDVLGYLDRFPGCRLPFQNLKRLHIESIPLRSPGPLLAELDTLVAERRGEGVPLRSISVKVKCEMLIPAAEHCAFLTSWGGLGGDVKLEYEQAEIRRLPRRRRRNRVDQWVYEDEDEDEEDESEDEDTEDEEPGTEDPSGCYVGWDGWPEKWPKVLGEMEG